MTRGVHIKPLGGVHPDDVLRAIEGLTGLHEAGDVYERYCAMSSRPPGSIRFMGMVLARLGVGRCRGAQGRRNKIRYRFPAY